MLEIPHTNNTTSAEAELNHWATEAPKSQISTVSCRLLARYQTHHVVQYYITVYRACKKQALLLSIPAFPKGAALHLPSAMHTNAHNIEVRLCTSAHSGKRVIAHVLSQAPWVIFHDHSRQGAALRVRAEREAHRADTWCALQPGGARYRQI
eukprot:IDg4952t1